MKGEGYGFDVIRQVPVTVRDRRYLAGFRAGFNCSATGGATCAEGGVLTVFRRTRMYKCRGRQDAVSDLSTGHQKEAVLRAGS